MRVVCVCVSLAFIAGGVSAATIQDNVFNNADWSLHSVQFGPNGGGGVAYQSAGLVETGRYVTNYCGNDYSGAWNYSIFDAQSYEPATAGPLSALSFSIDARYDDGLSAVSFALEQGGFIWRIGYFLNTAAWQTYTLAPAAADFTRMDGDSALPDFSEAGAPIHFGFGTANSSTSYGYARSGIYDNFVASFVPGPGAGAMLAGLAVTGLRRRRR